MTINPTADQVRAYRDAPDTGPVFMLNLLKFKAGADDGSGTGAEAYARYAASLDRMVRDRGGSVAFLGRASQVFIGEEPAADWDVVLLVRYPSRAAFLDMIADPGYAEAHAHREAGLAKTVLIACDPIERIG